jgi:molybdopterin molybdotransferase
MKPLPSHDVLLSPEQALASILCHVAPLGSEIVDLNELASATVPRILAAPLVSGRVLPPWDNSAMDGYALRAAEVVAGSPLLVQGTVAAGHPASQPLLPGTCLRIMTGAPVPDGADAVIMREEAEESEGRVRFRSPARPGQHIRRAGEDIRLGDLLLASGSPLGPGEVGVLAAVGRTLVEVHRRPQVTVLSTGDELVPADVLPGPGQITNSNSHALSAQIREAGGEPRLLPIVKDDPQTMRAAFAEALRSDVVVSSGGVSVGQFDYVRDVLAELGAVEQFSRVAMKPGKPLTFSYIDCGAGLSGRRVLWFGLPGNPASSMVSFELFVRPALRRLCGLPESAVQRPRAWVTLAQPVEPDRSRLHFTRARIERRTDPPAAAAPATTHTLWATPLAWQGSGMLRSMLGLNALLHIPPGNSPLPVGARVLATLLSPI